MYHVNKHLKHILWQIIFSVMLRGPIGEYKGIGGIF